MTRLNGIACFQGDRAILSLSIRGSRRRGGHAQILVNSRTLVERMIRTATTWALVDPLAARVAGALVERFPALAAI